ncbi:hypothetical protein [Fulvivirga sp.]|uniref:hypothetical protein n=1 Tax=Fulvivirga sp. TaxID=1931237 RepID=UPI0032EDAF2D
MKTIANTFGLGIPLTGLTFFYTWISESKGDALYVLFFGSWLILFLSLIISLLYTLFLSFVSNTNIWKEGVFVFLLSLIVITFYFFELDYGAFEWIDYLCTAVPIAVLSAFILVHVNIWTQKKI